MALDPRYRHTPLLWEHTRTSLKISKDGTWFVQTGSNAETGCPHRPSRTLCGQTHQSPGARKSIGRYAVFACGPMVIGLKRIQCWKVSRDEGASQVVTNNWYLYGDETVLSTSKRIILAARCPLKFHGHATPIVRYELSGKQSTCSCFFPFPE